MWKFNLNTGYKLLDIVSAAFFSILLVSCKGMRRSGQTRQVNYWLPNWCPQQRFEFCYQETLRTEDC